MGRTTRLALSFIGICLLATSFGSVAQGKVRIDSRSGSGAFGSWAVDRDGLPVYRYEIDQQKTPFARQPEIGDSTVARHQIGNQRALAVATNDGTVELWSQDRRYEWVNHPDPENDQLAGGFGWLRSGDRVFSTRYPDRPTGARTSRTFGVGYGKKVTASHGIRVIERTFAPKGAGPVLVHEVRIENRTSRRRKGQWFEYWGVNPYDQSKTEQIGVARPRIQDRGRVIVFDQRPTAEDRHPLSIFGAALGNRADGHATDAEAFFGSGDHKVPGAVSSNRLDPAFAGPVEGGATGRGMMLFRNRWQIRPGGTVAFRYAYGIAHRRSVSRLVAERRRDRSALQKTSRDWKRWLPKIRLGKGRSWLSRELMWSAYTLRSGVTYEECRKHRILSQGGYYQYELGFQGAFRDPLQHVLPMIYAEPGLTRDVILYSASEQPRASGQFPYAMSSLCRPHDALPDANDMDLWLLWTVAEYVYATRDLSILRAKAPWADGGTATLWTHLKRAFEHQESLIGPHGGYLTPGAGDWSDFSTVFLQMTESTLVSAQLAYVYPRVSGLARMFGDREFASELRKAGRRNLDVTRREWTGRGWYSRGYSGNRQLGSGAIFGEPQPWALLAGAASRPEARTLVGNVRRFLTGIGAPPEVKGPARIGSGQSPAANDPDVTERSAPVNVNTGDNNAVFVGGSWYAVNGWLAWALARQDGIVPGARRFAFDELLRNTLRAHARAYPKHWGGIISIDDACRSHNSTDPERCGIGLNHAYTGQIMHQPAWQLWDVLKLGGIEATPAGYDIEPVLPVHGFSIRMPRIGLEWSHGRAVGYMAASTRDRLRIKVAVPSRRHVTVRVEGRRVRSTRKDGRISFALPVRPGRKTHWRIAWR